MTTTELIKLLKKYEFGGATGRAREVSIEIGNDIYDTDIKDISTGDGLVKELYLTLSAEPKKGKWIYRYIKALGKYSITCPFCNDGYVDAERFNFCPNCGADMRGEEDG